MNKTTYSTYSEFYDQVEGTPSRSIEFIKNVIEQYVSSAESILELGCGTGNVIGALDKKYKKYGLDISEGMLKKANEKFSDISFFQGDMSEFVLDQKFDLIFCVYDSINHLLDKSQWEGTFLHAFKHLVNGGIFVVDMNTISKLRELSQKPPYSVKFDDNWLIMQVDELENNTFDWTVNIFEKVDNVNYKLNVEKVKEKSFEIESVEAMLKQHFEVLDVVNSKFEKVEDDNQRVFFICRKK